jgi:3-oxoacyl-[acyl-carrier protein] reductase
MGDRTAIVTGAATGIGRAIATRLAASGYRVAINYCTSAAEAQSTAAVVDSIGSECMLVQGDVTADADCRSLAHEVAAKWGRVDALVNNAGYTRATAVANLEDVAEADWDRTFAVNVKGAFLMTRACAAMLREARGCVVNVSSTAGVNAVGSSIAYSASKASLNNLTLSLARALAPHVRVNAVLPGYVETKWNERTLGERLPTVRKLVAQQTLLGGVGRPEHVAQLVGSIVESMDWVTGELIVVDGGLLARH